MGVIRMNPHLSMAALWESFNDKTEDEILIAAQAKMM